MYKGLQVPSVGARSHAGSSLSVQPAQPSNRRAVASLAQSNTGVSSDSAAYARALSKARSLVAYAKDSAGGRKPTSDEDVGRSVDADSTSSSADAEPRSTSGIYAQPLHPAEGNIPRVDTNRRLQQREASGNEGAGGSDGRNYSESGSRSTDRPFSAGTASSSSRATLSQSSRRISPERPMQYTAIGDSEYVSRLHQTGSDWSILTNVVSVLQNVVDKRGQKQGHRGEGASVREKKSLFANLTEGLTPREQRLRKVEAARLLQQQAREEAAAVLLETRDSIQSKYHNILSAVVGSAGGVDLAVAGAGVGIASCLALSGSEVVGNADEIRAADEHGDVGEDNAVSAESTSSVQKRPAPAGIQAEPLNSISVSIRATPTVAPPIPDFKPHSTSMLQVVTPQKVRSEASESWKHALWSARRSTGYVMSPRELRRMQFRLRIMPKRPKLSGGDAEEQGLQRKQQNELSQLVLLNSKMYNINLRHGYNDRLKRMVRKRLAAKAAVADSSNEASGAVESSLSAAGSLKRILSLHPEALHAEEEEEEAPVATETASPSSTYHPKVEETAKVMNQMLDVVLPDKAYFGRRGETLSGIPPEEVKEKCMQWFKVCGEEYSRKFLAKEPSLLAKPPAVLLHFLEVINSVLLPGSEPSKCVDWALKNTVLVGIPAQQLSQSISTVASMLDVHEEAARRLVLKNTTLLTVPPEILKSNFEVLLQLFPVTLEKLRSMITSRPALLTRSAASHAHLIASVATFMDIPLFNAAVLIAGSPGLVGVSLERLEARWHRLVQVCALAPHWQSQLQSYAPPILGRLLKVPEKSVDRLEKIAVADKTKLKEAAEVKKLLTMSDELFSTIFRFKMEDEVADEPSLLSPSVEQEEEEQQEQEEEDALTKPSGTLPQLSSPQNHPFKLADLQQGPVPGAFLPL